MAKPTVSLFENIYIINNINDNGKRKSKLCAINTNVQVYTKEFRRGFGDFEKDKNKGVCTKAESFCCTRVRRNCVRFFLTKKP